MKNRLYIKPASIVFIIIAILSILSSCEQTQSHEGTVSSTPANTKQPVTTNTVESGIEPSKTEEQEWVKSLDDLYRSYRPLKIQQNSKNTIYEASKPLVHIFGDMLSKVQEFDMNVPEGEKLAKEFDYNYYDYRLKFEGAADILFTLKGNIFHFEGEKQLYTLWGDSKSFWDSLIIDNSSSSIDLGGDNVQVMVKSYNEDVNGDGAVENIELAYERGKNEDFKGDLTLSINGSRITTVLANIEWSTKPFRSMGEMPELWFQQEESGKSNAILLIYSWATNGVGSTGVINAYKYVDGHISDIEVKEPERVIKYKGKNVLSISFPALQRIMEVKADTDEYKKFLREEDSLKQVFERKDSFYSHPLWYLVKDYNGDGQAELCSVSLLRWEPMYKLDLGRVHTYYKYNNGELKPVQAFIASFYNDDEKKKHLTDYIFDLINFNGYLTVGDKGIMDANFMPGYDYTPDQIKKTLKELQENKILKSKEDRLYINY